MRVPCRRSQPAAATDFGSLWVVRRGRSIMRSKHALQASAPRPRQPVVRGVDHEPGPEPVAFHVRPRRGCVLAGGRARPGPVQHHAAAAGRPHVAGMPLGRVGPHGCRFRICALAGCVRRPAPPARGLRGALPPVCNEGCVCWCVGSEQQLDGGDLTAAVVLLLTPSPSPSPPLPRNRRLAAPQAFGRWSPYSTLRTALLCRSWCACLPPRAISSL